MCQISRLLLWKSPQECQNVTFEFCFTMGIFYELRYTVIIEIVWTFYIKSVPAKFQKDFKLISWVISGTSLSKLSCNPRHPSRNISCSHRHHLLQPSWRRIFSTSNNQKTRVDSDINIDYKANSFDKIYIWRRKWDTAGFIRAHQRKYWNALTVGRGHADDGCSFNHRAVPPSDITPNKHKTYSILPLQNITWNTSILPGQNMMIQLIQTHKYYSQATFLLLGLFDQPSVV